MQTNNVFLTSEEPCKHKIYIVDDNEQTGQCLGCGAEGRMQFVIGVPTDEVERLRAAMREAQPFCMTDGARILRDAEQYAAQEVAAEREKCAGECESEASIWEADGRGVAIEARLCAARIRARSTVTQPTKVRLPDELGPLPARVVVDRHTPTGVVTYGYTDAMVTAYAAEQVAKERERCASGARGEVD